MGIIEWRHFVVTMQPVGTVTLHECSWCKALVVDVEGHEVWHSEQGDFTP